jgi:Do/DeqQ family serine protease
MKQKGLVILAVLFYMQTISISCNRKENPIDDTSTDTGSTTPTGNTKKPALSNGMVDFVAASKAVTPAVVHIKIRMNSSADYAASGSGVIISTDGFIATNNHVVENATEIDVTLPDKRTLKARLIGRDPNTDLALIKVDTDSLPTVQLGNSDIVEVGEWVLAVGFPLSLNTTVTAGIVSAKARSIGIINRPNGNAVQRDVEQVGNTAVESFIQTDAAINSGNSGGALVNTSGELIGINSAIASQTGSYAGYAFAIPVNLAKKILDDLKQYGEVRRGVLGVSFPSPSAEDEYFSGQGLNPALVKGVYITGVQGESAASIAGLKEGDIIQSIDGTQLSSSTEFTERIARHKPGDVIKLVYLRDGKTTTTSVTLKGEEPKTLAKSQQPLLEIYNKLGASFAPLTPSIKQRFSLNQGVLVTDVGRGGFFDRVGISPGTIIAFINGKPINNPNDIDTALLAAQRGLIQIFAIAPDGSKVIFEFSMGT